MLLSAIFSLVRAICSFRRRREKAKAMEKPKSDPKPNFMTLPAELQNLIYRFVLHEAETIVIDKKSPPAQPALLQTCRQIRNDASGIYYFENTFTITIRGFDASTLIAWSKTSPLRTRSIQQGLIVIPRTYRPWEDLLKWLKAFWRGECGGLYVKGAVGDLRHASQMFQWVLDMRRMVQLKGKRPKRWPKVLEDMLEDQRSLLALMNPKWAKRVDEGMVLPSS